MKINTMALGTVSNLVELYVPFPNEKISVALLYSFIFKWIDFIFQTITLYVYEKASLMIKNVLGYWNVIAGG